MFLFKAKILQTGLRMLCFLFPECGYILCKDYANGRKESPLPISRVQIILCKDRKKMIVTQ